MLGIKCFGGLRVERNGQIIERFRTQKTASLLGLLALRGSQSREKICHLLWPDAVPEAARNSLSAALSALRRDLGEGVLKADRQNVALHSGTFEVDVRTFDESLKAQDFARAIKIYQGHFLPGFYEDPLPALAREYEEKARFTFSARLAELEKETDFAALLAVANRATVLFGDDERWLLAMMRAHQGRGDFTSALRIYENFSRSVRKDGEITSETARALAKTIRREKEKQFQIVTEIPTTIEGIHQNKILVPKAQTSLVNFPIQWTRFFGRISEREMLRVWLQDGPQLITLSGAGGSGKTRLAIETIADVASQWDSVYFVPLATLFDHELLYISIRDALSLAATSDSTPLNQLEQTLTNQKALLLLDNFEQLVENGAQYLQLLREKLPQVTFLVTSRVLLNLPGEREFPVAPLPTPLQNTALESVRDCASTALFSNRSSIAIDAENVEAIGALCRRLDGIPLAIELAAARAKMFTPTQILERVDSHPNFLQSRELGLPDRHKTLSAAITWSVDLLSPELRRLFTQLSFFRGGWNLEAAEAVCSDLDMLENLTQLRENSLILVEKGDAEPRFRMLETLREFGLEEISGEERRQTELAFFNYFLCLAQEAATYLGGPKQKEWLSRLDTEQDNLRKALEWARQHDHRGGLSLATALIDYWETRLRLDEGRHWLETFLEFTEDLAATKLEIRARALSGIGRLAWYSSDISKADEYLEQGLTAAQRAGDTPTMIYAMRSLARIIAVSGSYERARILGRESVQLSRETGDKSLLIGSLIDLSFAELNVAQFEKAALCSEEAVGLANDEHDEHGLCVGLLTWALSLYYLERLDEAMLLLDQCEKRSKQLGAIWELTACLSLRGATYTKNCDFTAARFAYNEMFNIIPRSQFKSWNGVNILFSLIISFLRRGEAEKAICLLGGTDAIRDLIGYTWLPFMKPEIEDIQLAAREILGDSAYQEAWQSGYGLTPEQTIQFAMNSNSE